MTSFRVFSCAFSNQFSSSKKPKNEMASLLTVAQKKSEGLRKYIYHFNTVRLEVGMYCDDVTMVTFMASLGKKTNKPLLRSLYVNPPEDFESTLARAKGYMLVDKALNFSKEDREPPKKSHKRTKEEETPHK